MTTLVPFGGKLVTVLELAAFAVPPLPPYVVRRRLALGRSPEEAIAAPHTPRAKLTAEQVQEIRRLFVPPMSRRQRGRLRREVSERYGITRCYVGFLVEGLYWKGRAA